MVFSISMSTGMDIHFIVGDQFHSFSEQIIEHSVCRGFIARDSGRRHKDGISFSERHLCMLSSGHSCECGEFFSLRSGTKNQDSVVRHIIDIIIKLADHSFRSIDIAKLLTDIDIIDHGSSGKKDHSIVSDGAIYDLDNPTYIGGKGCNENPSRGIFDLRIDSFSYDLFRFCPSGILRAKTISGIEFYSFSTDSGNFCQISLSINSRSMIYLEITRIEDYPLWCIDG